MQEVGELPAMDEKARAAMGDGERDRVLMLLPAGLPKILPNNERDSVCGVEPTVAGNKSSSAWCGFFKEFSLEVVVENMKAGAAEDGLGSREEERDERLLVLVGRPREAEGGWDLSRSARMLNGGTGVSVVVVGCVFVVEFML